MPHVQISKFLSTDEVISYDEWEESVLWEVEWLLGIIGMILDPDLDRANTTRNFIILQIMKKKWVKTSDGLLMISMKAARELIEKAESMLKPGYEDQNDLVILNKIGLKKRVIQRFMASYEKNRLRKQ